MKCMKPKITIGIPVYNVSIHIKNRLEGILNQSFSNFEVIISDNASTDMTQEICKEFERKDSRITYKRQEENQESTLNFIYVLNKAQ